MSGREWGAALLLGWRNLWRNTRRSVITGLAIAAAFMILIVLTGMLGGVRHQLLRNGTELMLGHLQIHHAEYLPDRHIADTIESDDLDALLGRLAAHQGIRAAAPRVRAQGLISSGDSSAGAQLLGVHPELESAVTALLHEAGGEGLPAEPGSYRLVLGVDLAREIGAAVGSELAVVAQAADGSMGNELFTVSSIFRTGLRNVDRSLVAAHYADLQEMLALGSDSVHEIALLTPDPFEAGAFAPELAGAGLLPEGSRVRAWGEISPQLRDYIAFSDSAGGFLTLVIGLFAAFGVMNSMLMAVYERTREFGALNAMGTRPVLILSSLVAEALLIAVLGLAAGLAAGAAVMFDMAGRGWDLAGLTGELNVMDARLDPVLYGVWVWDDVVFAAVGLLVASLVAALIPAARILRLNPVEAMSAPQEG